MNKRTMVGGSEMFAGSKVDTAEMPKTIIKAIIAFIVEENMTVSYIFL